MPAMTAREALDATFALSADEVEAIIDRMIARQVERKVCCAVSLTDRDLGAGTFIWWLAHHQRTHPVLTEVISRYQIAGYEVIVKASESGNCNLSRKPARIDISWGRA